MSWAVVPLFESGDIHVLPVNDLREHELEPTCWCQPRRDDTDEAIVIHYAADNRRLTEGKLQ